MRLLPLTPAQHAFVLTAQHGGTASKMPEAGK